MAFDLGILLCVFIVCRGRRFTVWVGRFSLGRTQCPLCLLESLKEAAGLWQSWE